MTNLTAILIMAALAAQATCAPQLNRKITNETTYFGNNAANLSEQELKNVLHVTSPKTLTPCAKAILACCRGTVINENCSETLQCGSHFFDPNPCEEKVVIAALEAAKEFYDQFNTVP